MERPVRSSEESGVVDRILIEEAVVERGGLLATAWDWTKSLLVAFLLFVVIRAFAVEAFKIPTSSMESTLLVGDFVLVNRAIFGPRIPGTDVRLPAIARPQRGEVVVFSPPHEPDKNYVKRLVGLPFDTLSMRDKRLYLNGSPVYEPYAQYIDQRGDAAHPDMRWQSNHLIASPFSGARPTRDNWGPIVVPADRYFMLGDNRDDSEDSRYWGFVRADQIHGKPWFVYYSFDATAAGRAPRLQEIRWWRLGDPIR